VEQLHLCTHIKLIFDVNATCKSSHIINEDLTMTHLGKQKIQTNQPIFTGMVILDIAKTVRQLYMTCITIES